jgi:hypothetical protein
MTCPKHAPETPCDDGDGYRSPIILFDTDCPVCSGMVAFVLAHERDHLLRFAGPGRRRGWPWPGGTASAGWICTRPSW